MRAKNHDQRKGQWLINKIRSAKDFPHPTKKQYEELGLEKCGMIEKSNIELRLWNMENDEFDKLIGDYND